MPPDGATRWSRTLDLVCVAAAAVVAALFRLPKLGASSLWLDEIINVDIVRTLGELAPWKWLAGFEPENGPLYYALQWLAQQLPYSIETVTRLPAAVVGTLSVPLMYALARKYRFSRGVAFGAAMLLAVSPLHVYYSREGRTYALLTFAVMLALYGLADASRRGVRAFIVAVVIAAFTAASAAPMLVVLLFLALLQPREQRDRWRVFAACIALALVPLLYLRHTQPPNRAGFATDSVTLARTIGVGFAQAAVVERAEPSYLPRTLWLSFAIGVAALLAGRDRRFRPLVYFAPLVVLVTVAALIATDHWFSLRYVIQALPPFLLIAAAGVAALVRGLFRREAAGSVAALLFAMVVTVFQAPASLAESNQRADWRGAATVIARHSTDRDVVVTGNDWASISISFYLRELQSNVRVVSAAESITSAEIVIAGQQASWILSAGAYADGTIAEWMCRYPLLFGDYTEELRLHHLRDVPRLMIERASAAERERYAEAFDARERTLELVPGDEMYLGSGWYQPESEGRTSFRWCQHRCTMLLGAPRSGGVLSFRMRVAAEIEPPFVDVVIDGEFRRVGLAREWATYSVPIPPASSRLRLVEFRFPDEISPSEKGLNDPRRFSAAVDWVVVGAAPPRVDPASMFLLQPQESPTAAAASERDRLLLRLGSSPRPLSHRGLVEEIWRATSTLHCLGDEEFVDFVFRILYMRTPDPAGKITYASMLRRGKSRRRVIERMTESDEFLRRFGAAPR